MSKHSGENTLLQIFSNIKSKVDYLKGLIDAKQQPFNITAVCDFTNGVLTDVSCTFDELTGAYERGDHVFLDVDISQRISGQRVLIALVSFLSGTYAAFEQVMSMPDGNSYHVSGMIFPDGGSNVQLMPLVQSGQLGDIDTILDNINGEVI